jgi:catalase
MPDYLRDPADRRPPLSPAAIVARLGAIGVVLLCSTVAFAYTGGWLSPARLTPQRMIAGFEATNGPHPGFRRNHAKGVCATGWFESDGKAASLSKATVFASGRVPVVARIAFAGGMPFIPDDPATVRSLALRFLPEHGEEWRTGMINIPVFPFLNAQEFYDQMIASLPDETTGKPDPAKMQAFVATHPAFLPAIGIIKTRPVSSGFANATYNSINTFRFINAAGDATQVRWSAVPVQPFVAASDAPPVVGKNGLFDALIAEVAKKPVQWQVMVTVGQPTDTTNPTLPWPSGRLQIDAGTVTLDHLASEDGGPCLNVNYDPTILPSGIEPSDDPLLSTRSATYSRSFTLREDERGEKPPSAVTPQEVAAGGKS